MFSEKRFSFDNIPDLSGKVAIVTGANTGIGFVTARELVRKNAHVFIASHSKDRGEPAVELIKKETKKDSVEFLQLELKSLNSVKRAAETFLARNLTIAYSLFTLLLLPTIKASAPSRIVNVSSKGHHRTPPTGIEFEKLNDPNAHTSFQRYAQSKLANILFTIELNKRLSETNVYCNSLHPGIIKTEITRGIVANWGTWLNPIISITSLFLLSPDDGALTQLYCATSPEIEEKNLCGRYFEPFGEIGEPSAQGKDEELAKKLWNFSENLIKEKLGDVIFINHSLRPSFQTDQYFLSKYLLTVMKFGEIDKTLTCLSIKIQIFVFYLNIQCRKKFAIILNVTNDKLKIFQ
ncbi:hypothetical protein C2G38_2138145 [Gigaspora rosea]|uniref:NAD(P)-binding protein n=1 Tax=Gigaspora rosea TaxID=44941 RepID=A0A397VY59_9GLOM|nr:hypothetical protein C2G38_2138145 [Gigaspora rosea]